jgi:hypothetical protein
VLQHPTADLASKHGESTPLIVRQPHTVAARLRLQHAILFTQEVDHVALFSIEPPGQRREDQLSRDHDENLPDSNAV